MKRTYQSRRRKLQPKLSNNDQHSLTNAQHDENTDNNAYSTNKSKPKHDQVINKYYSIHSKSHLKRLSSTPAQAKIQSKRSFNLGNNRIYTKNKNKNKNVCTYSDTDNDDNELYESDKETELNIECKFNDNVSIKSESLDSTTSFLSLLSLKNRKQKQLNENNNNNNKNNKNNNNKNKIKTDELTLDDICNDDIDISEQYFDPESMPKHMDKEWPSWVSKAMIERSQSPTRKRKRNDNSSGSPPSKKLKSPNKINNKSLRVFSTVRKNKKRARRRSSLDFLSNNDNDNDMETPIMNVRRMNKRKEMIYGDYGDIETPIASIRTQRIHRLTRKSNTDLLFDVLLRENNGECPQLNKLKQELDNGKGKNKNKNKNKSRIKNKKICFDDLNGLSCIGAIDNLQERLCSYLLSFGADPLLLNSDGVSTIYIAMHYRNNYNVISTMINKSKDMEELNQTYIFAKHGTISLLDIALRIGELKTIKLLLQNDMMPTRHSIDLEPKIELLSFCKQHRMTKLANKILREQLFDAVENLDIEYIESIICHGIDINFRIDTNTNKTCLYFLVQQAFDIYDELDAKDQYETIVCLLKNGANPNCLDSNKTPMLIYPLQRSGPWNIKLVDILLYYGANLKLKVGHTNKSLYVYAKQNCVCNQILKVITNYYNIGKNNKKKNLKSNKKKEIKTIEVKVTTNSTLTSMIKTKNVVTKNYKRNRKSAKGQ